MKFLNICTQLVKSTTNKKESVEVSKPVKVLDKTLRSIFCSRIPNEYMYEEKIKEVFSEWDLYLYKIIKHFV